MEQLLHAWERGRDQPPPSRALLLLAVAEPGASAEDLLRLTPGECDARLLELREMWFGRELEALADCPVCGHTAEAAIDLRALRQSGAQLPVDTGFRLPTCRDLIEVASAPDVAVARRRLLGRCLEEESSVPGDADAISAQMADADPQAALEIELTCPDCARPWSLPFEIGSILWQEFSAWARDLLEDVHALASAYGWSEAEILALSPVRRRLYLEMVAG